MNGMTPSDRIRDELSSLQQRHRFREMSFIPDSSAESGGSADFKDFSSNDYLSLNEGGILKNIFKNIPENLFRGSTGSRLLSGHSEVFEEAETEMARWTGSEAALLYANGYSANTGTMDALFSPRDVIFTDRLCHASLLDGIRLSGARRIYFRHNDLNDLEEKLKKASESGEGAGSRDPRSVFWIVTESVFSMDGDSPDFHSLQYLSEKYNAFLYIDEAHAVGLFGRKGAGRSVTDEFAGNDRFAVRVFPMGKAPGLSGAFVCGSRLIKDYLVNNSRSFIFSTAPLPVLPWLLTQVIGVLKKDNYESVRRSLQEKARLFRESLKASGFNTLSSESQIIPVLYGSEEEVMRIRTILKDNRISAGAIRPPAVPENESRLRISIRSGHSEEDLKFLIQNLIDFRQPAF